MFQVWAEVGVMEQVLHTLARDLKERGGLDLIECFVDATFASAEKGALASLTNLNTRLGAAKAARSWKS